MCHALPKASPLVPPGASWAGGSETTWEFTVVVHLQHREPNCRNIMLIQLVDIQTAAAIGTALYSASEFDAHEPEYGKTAFPVLYPDVTSALAHSALHDVLLAFSFVSLGLLKLTCQTKKFLDKLGRYRGLSSGSPRNIHCRGTFFLTVASQDQRYSLQTQTTLPMMRHCSISCPCRYMGE